MLLASLLCLLPGDLPFETTEIETGLGVGYAVLLVDLNGDGKKDIVVVEPDARCLVREPDLEAAHHHPGPDQARQRLHRGLRHRRRRPARSGPRRRLEAVQHQGGRHAAMAQARQDARRPLDALPHRRGADRPPHPLRRPRRRAASRPWSSPPSWAAAAPRKRTGWTAPLRGCWPSASPGTRCATAGRRRSSTRAFTSSTISIPFRPATARARAWTS